MLQKKLLQRNGLDVCTPLVLRSYNLLYHKLCEFATLNIEILERNAQVMEFTSADISRLSGYSYIPKTIYNDDQLSLKAKGLLSWARSCPETWQFTINGIAAVHSDGVASVKSAIKELTEKKYLIVTRERDANGRLGNSSFQFFDIPYGKTSETSIEFVEIEGEGIDSNICIEELPVTLMSNYHLRDINLSLKAKGLLSLMFSLPRNWHFTEKNLKKLCSDGLSGVRSAVQELKESKYLRIEQLRNEKGYLDKSKYYFYRIPYDKDRNTVSPEVEIPHTDIPHADKPILENPTEDKPLLEKETQIKTNSTKTNKNKFYSNKYLHHHLETVEELKEQMTFQKAKRMIEETMIFKIIKKLNVELIQKFEQGDISEADYNTRRTDERVLQDIINTMAEVYATKKEEIAIGKNSEVTKEFLLCKFEKMGYMDVQELVTRIILGHPVNKTAYILRVIANY